MIELTASEREAAIALARRAIEAAARNGDLPEQTSSGELEALRRYDQAKQSRYQPLIDSIHKAPIDRGDEDDD